MPQRLTQTAGSAGFPLEFNGRKLFASRDQLVAIVQSRLGQAHGDLFAVPKPTDDGAIEWSTRLAGEAVPATSLLPEERQKVERIAQRLLNDVRSLGEQLRSEGASALMVGQMLEQATRFPSGDWLYSVGGKPVMLMWGHSDALEQSAHVVAAPASKAVAAAAVSAPEVPVVAAVAAPAAAVDVGVTQVAAASGSRGIWRWLVGGLFLLAIVAFVLLGLKRCSDLSGRTGDFARQISEAEAANKALEAEIAKTRADTPKFICVRPPDPTPPPAPEPTPPPQAAAEPPPAAPPVEPTPEPPTPKVAEAPKVDPYDALTKKVNASKKDCKALQQLTRDPLIARGKDPRAAPLKEQVMQALQQNCKEQMIKEAKNMCPGQRPKELAPELALVFDASGSMRFSLDVTEQEIQQMAAMDAMQNMMKQFLGGRGGPGVDMARLTREPSRITAAKQAAVAAVQRAPSDSNIGLVLVDQCPAARSAGYYPPARRGELLGGLQSIQPRGGTPLADGVAKAGQMIDGVTREALMVVISDGVESCGQDPCAVAAALARSKPHLKINVVDITGTGAGNCLAKATGGRVFTARNAAEVAAMTRRAAEDVMGPANCAK
ncbi:VWA domain-containing protein [Variovorax rhizosphaerae]|uniref:VWA domain-containing protein n=1 Tax=Variovorax rhizosphaerae TaxID=1836200 RepID=A0ABU8WRD5_9BURK